ncbi:hypothetical protein D3C87_1875160 [compost metagenome]
MLGGRFAVLEDRCPRHPVAVYRRPEGILILGDIPVVEIGHTISGMPAFQILAV